MPRRTVTIYDTCKFVTLVPRKTAIFSFESLCFIYKAFDFLTEFIEACLFYMLAVLHFTCDSRSFCYLHCCGSTVSVHQNTLTTLFLPRILALVKGQ